MVLVEQLVKNAQGLGGSVRLDNLISSVHVYPRAETLRDQNIVEKNDTLERVQNVLKDAIYILLRWAVVKPRETDVKRTIEHRRLANERPRIGSQIGLETRVSILVARWWTTGNSHREDQLSVPS